MGSTAEHSPAILVTGAAGQLGIELTARLRAEYGTEKVLATDIRPSAMVQNGPFEKLDVLDRDALSSCITSNGIDHVYHLAALLSAKGESQYKLAWQLNMQGLLDLLELAADGAVSRIFWPSSIAVFGPELPREMVPQQAPLNPATVYGISKVAGEHWNSWYYHRFGVDVRSVRYPGLIGFRSEAGGGTTDYAVDMYQAARKGAAFTCPVNKNTRLPMMYMDDAVKAAITLMKAPVEQVKVRTSYNLAAMSFTPDELLQHIAAFEPGLRVTYKPDHREQIASGWPDSIDDSEARNDWGWNPDFDLQAMTAEIMQATSA